MAGCPAPKKEEHAGPVFLTQRGLAWAKDANDCPITKETAKLLHRLGNNVEARPEIGFARTTSSAP
jgi:hypothetical protein